MNVFELMAKISLDKSEYNEGLEEASKESESTASKIGGALGKAGKVAGAGMLAVGTAVTAVSKKFVDGVSDTAKFGDEIDKNSQKMGVSAEFYQEWDAVLQHSGTSMSSMTSTFKTLANVASDATDAQSKALEKLGLTSEDLGGSSEQAFTTIITALQGMEEGTERNAIAQDLLGKGATELGALFNTSASDTQNMIDTVHELGGVLSDDAIKASAGFQDSLQNLQTSLTGLQNGAFALFLPAMTDVMDGLTKIFSGDDSGVQQIADGVNNIADKIIENLPKLIEVGMRIIEALGQAIMENLPTLIESATQIITALVQMLIENLPLLISMTPQIIMAIGKGIIGAIPQLATSATQTMTSLKDMFMNLIPSFMEIGKNIVDGLWKGISSGWSSLTSNVGTKVKGLVSSVKNGLGIHSPSKVFAEIGEYCAEGFDEGIEDLMDTDAMMSNINDGIGAIQGAVGDATAEGGSGAIASDQNISVNITLAGDADGIFRVVRQESQKYYKSTGRQAFA